MLLVTRLLLENLDQYFTHQKMDSNIEPTGLDGFNYTICVTDMYMFLKCKCLWKHTMDVIPDPYNASTIFFIGKNKDEDVGVIVTHILQEIQFHTSGIECPHEIWKKMKSLFNKVEGSLVMQREKELISLDPHSFERIEDYLACINELQLKLGKCRKVFLEKDA